MVDGGQNELVKKSVSSTQFLFVSFFHCFLLNGWYFIVNDAFFFKKKGCISGITAAFLLHNLDVHNLDDDDDDDDANDDDVDDDADEVKTGIKT